MLNLKEIAKATGGTLVTCEQVVTSATSFKLNNKLERMLQDIQESDSLEKYSTKEIKDLSVYLSSKIQYGQDIIDSVPKNIVPNLLRVIRTAGMKARNK